MPNNALGLCTGVRQAAAGSDRREVWATEHRLLVNPFNLERAADAGFLILGSIQRRSLYIALVNALLAAGGPQTVSALQPVARLLG